MTEFLDERRNALEETFFAKKDRELIERLKAEKEESALKAELAELSGISDDDILGSLVSQGISPSTMAALSLVPLVEMAWADQVVQDRERKAIKEAAAKSGIVESSAAGKLLDQWLDERPSADLLEAWKLYVAQLVKSLPAGTAASLKSEVLGRAEKVATAAGGILGVGRFSSEEREKLEELDAAFNG